MVKRQTLISFLLVNFLISDSFAEEKPKYEELELAVRQLQVLNNYTKTAYHTERDNRIKLTKENKELKESLSEVQKEFSLNDFLLGNGAGAVITGIVIGFIFLNSNK